MNEGNRLQAAAIENQLSTLNARSLAYQELRNSILILENCNSTFESQVNLGMDLFVEAVVDCNRDALVFVNVGLGVFVGFRREEALTFIEQVCCSIQEDCDRLQQVLHSLTVQ